MNHSKVITMLEEKNRSKYVKYIIENSPNPCNKCRVNIGTYRYSDGNIPIIPVHPNCKCKIVNIIDTDEIKKNNVSFGTKDNAKELKTKPMKGYERDYYTIHDEIIAYVVAEFNENKASWTGCSATQAKKISDMSASLLKSHLIQESGGSPFGWRTDPGQINNPGDWVEDKRTLGLNPPSKNNTDTLYIKIRATLIGLTRKGFGKSYIPVQPRRASAFFDGWEVAFQRYNVGRGLTSDGRPVSHEYARRIIYRANHSNEYVPVEFKKIE